MKGKKVLLRRLSLGIECFFIIAVVLIFLFKEFDTSKGNNFASASSTSATVTSTTSMDSDVND